MIKSYLVCSRIYFLDTYIFKVYVSIEMCNSYRENQFVGTFLVLVILEFP